MTVDDQLSRKWVHPSMGFGLLVLLSNSAHAHAYATNTISLHRNLNATIEQTQMKRLFEDAIDANVFSTLAPTSYHDKWLDDDNWKGEYWPRHLKIIAILRGTSGITSVISSSIFIWMIMRSHDRLSTTQHRLFLGLCISDILSSLCHSTFNMHLPSNDFYNYWSWNARGNEATWNAQEFLLLLGVFGGLFYNASLNLYFLAVVKYNKSDEFIRAKMEPFLHGIPIVVALCYSIYRLVKSLGYYYSNELFGAPIDSAHISLLIIPAVIMVVSLGMIYCAVRTQEKKLAKYGVGALRSNHQQQSASTPQQRTVQDKQSSGTWGRMTMSLTALSTSLKSRTWSCRNTNKPVTRSNNVQSQSRAVMHKAFGYTFAWFLSYGLYLIAKMTLKCIKVWDFPFVLDYIAYICMPLQGLFNLLIFMHPKIMAAKKPKKRGETVSWCKAFSTAFWSKGKKSKNRGTSRSNLRGRSNRPLRKTRNENALSDDVKTPMFGGIKKKTKKKRERAHQEEEEKCEIQVPDNLNPTMTRAMYSAASPAIYERNNVPPPSTENSTEHTVNLAAADDDMVGMEKADVVENVNGGNALSDIVEDPYEDSMMSQDEEEEMNDVEKGSKEIVPMAVADVNKQKEISMEYEDEGKEMSADDQA